MHPFHRLNGRVKKRAMTSFEKDKMMSSLSPQLDYSVCVSFTCYSIWYSMSV